MKQRRPAAKILVAIHGIGDQVGYETAQSVARQVGAYYDISAAIPLGRFYTPLGHAAGSVPVPPPAPMPVLLTNTDNAALLQKTGFDIGFAEVYWASIPRQIVNDGHILEESKKWAKTVAARLAQRAQSHCKPMPAREQVRLTTVLDEMIETLAVIERLNFVLAKAGIFQFNLNKLLTDFLGDVQIVVDFQVYREQILDAFSSVMNQAMALGTDGQERELYLIGHSEGSVITFLAVLKALADQDKYPWIRAVRGIMTIGSPIEVHHLLWPNLWQDLTPDATPTAAALKIPWQNYYDFGDPIAYQLTATRKWLARQGFDRILTLEENEYSRSYLPGKAHVDYWSDKDVFAHFVDGVVCGPKPVGVAPAPNSKWSAIAVSYAIPKLLILTLMCLASYVIYRPVANAILPETEAANVDASIVFADVFGIGLLLLGVTTVARLPRLTNKWRWWLVAAVFLLVSMVGYEWVVTPASQAAIGRAFANTWLGPTRGVQLMAGLVALVAGALASWFPAWGTRILPITGLIAIAGLMGDLIWGQHGHNELWPVAFGALVFFYLWRMAALLFDLVFIWHRYIRHAAALDSIAEVSEKGYEGSVLEQKWDDIRRRRAPAKVATS